MSKFGQRIKKLREREKLSVRKLAEKAGISHSYLSQLENGRRSSPKPPTIMKIAKGLNVPYSDLMIASGYIGDVDFNIIKTKNGRPTVIEYDGFRYTLQHPNQYERS